MKKFVLMFCLLGVPAEASVPPTSYPLFLRQGFSCVLEFESTPKRVVIGDLQSFQVEKMEMSLVVRALTPYASSNMFVYFETGEPRLFVLSASEDAEPTLYRKFENPKVMVVKNEKAKIVTSSRSEGMRVSSAKFYEKKDYLTIDVVVSAGIGGPIKPSWELVRLMSGDKAIVPLKTWAERKEVQKYASLRARFIFAKPNVRRDLKDVRLVLPIQGRTSPFLILMGGK
jgi:hypothetical protein